MRKRLDAPDSDECGSASASAFSSVFNNFHFLWRHGASSLATVNTPLWSPEFSGKVSRSTGFGCSQAHGVCTAGAPKRVEQGFCCTKSAKSASGTLHAHFVNSLWKQMHTLCRLCKHLMKTLSMHTRCRLTAHLDLRTICRLIAHVFSLFFCTESVVCIKSAKAPNADIAHT